MKKLFAALALAAVVAPVWAATQTVTLSVPGMTCASCPITVKHALSKVEGVSKTDVSFDKRQSRRHLRRCQDQRPEVDQGDRGRGLSVQPQTLIR